ncbi:hypothetical protein ACFFX0_30985 [Citricoccus parietis]|uniref:Uncharacterized protein n=1 Tax=Citricoccus parietis TaxID=592307 RepID=A0ABV5G8X4_9MICC
MEIPTASNARAISSVRESTSDQVNRLSRCMMAGLSGYRAAVADSCSCSSSVPLVIALLGRQSCRAVKTVPQPLGRSVGWQSWRARPLERRQGHGVQRPKRFRSPLTTERGLTHLGNTNRHSLVRKGFRDSDTGMVLRLRSCGSIALAWPSGTMRTMATDGPARRPQPSRSRNLLRLFEHSDTVFDVTWLSFCISSATPAAGVHRELASIKSAPHPPVRPAGHTLSRMRQCHHRWRRPSKH